MNETMLEAALHNASRGRFVLPCNENGDPGDKNSPCKKPYSDCAPNGVKDATTDPAIITTWWKKHPNAMIGVACGPSHLIAIDLDCHGGDQDGPAKWKEMGLDVFAQGTMVAETLRNGVQIWFSYDGDAIKGNENGLGSGIGIRAGNQYAIVPPSRNHTRAYRLISETDDIKPLPKALEMLILMAEGNNGHSAKSNGKTRTPPDAARIEEAKKALERLAFSRCDMGDSWRAVGYALLDGLGDAGLPLWIAWSKQSPKFKAGECEAKWEYFKQHEESRNGELITYATLFFYAKEDRPNEDELQELLEALKAATPAEQRKLKRQLANALAMQDIDVQEEYAQLVKEAGICGKTVFMKMIREAMGDARREPTQDEMRDAWLEEHSDILWDSSTGDFREYSEGRWQVIDEDIVVDSISDMIISFKSRGVYITETMIRSVAAMIKRKIARGTGQWDTDLNILVMKTKTLVLSERRCRDHSPKDYATTKLDFDYDPSAACPMFLRVVNDGMDPETVAMTQEFTGLCLTPDVLFEVALWLIGKAGSGKSTIIESIAAMMGEKAGNLTLADFVSRFGFSDLKGQTMLRATEQPGDYLRDVTKLNAFISGEPVQIEKKNVDKFWYKPVAKLFWAMNAAPRIPNSHTANEGAFRRINVIRMNPIPEDKRDPSLKDRLLRGEESAGILNWALDGLDRLRARGTFRASKASKAWTLEYQELGDVVEQWISEHCIKGDKLRLEQNQAYADFRLWCEKAGIDRNRIKDKRSFNDALGENGLGFKIKQGDGNFKNWAGIALRDRSKDPGVRFVVDF